MTKTLQAPFPYFGGKRSIASAIWRHIGVIDNYVEPFGGSLAMLLANPHHCTETVNDADGLLCNFWRSVKLQPKATAKAADWPVSEADLHARHWQLTQKREDVTDRLMGDPTWCDPQLAGWWVWGACAWIGPGWCSGAGSWVVQAGSWVVQAGKGVSRKLPHLGNRGQGINRQLPHLGDRGRGINRQRSPHVSRTQWIQDWFKALSERLRDVRVCCGDWKRVLGPTPTTQLGTTCVFLDPPYAAADRTKGCYAVDSYKVAKKVRLWCKANGSNPQLKIVLCGYQGEGHERLEKFGWTTLRWKAKGGFSNQSKKKPNKNPKRETVWFSPACKGRVRGMFAPS